MTSKEVIQAADLSDLGRISALAEAVCPELPVDRINGSIQEYEVLYRYLVNPNGVPDQGKPALPAEKVERLIQGGKMLSAMQGYQKLDAPLAEKYPSRRHLVGFEQLIRLVDPENELHPVSPGRFIETALADIRLAVKMGLFSIRDAARMTEGLRKRGYGTDGEPVIGSVNISHALLGSEDFIPTVEGVMRTHSFAPNDVHAELLETIDPKTLTTIERERLRALSKLMEICIDDYRGTAQGGMGDAMADVLQQEGIEISTVKICGNDIFGVGDAGNTAKRESAGRLISQAVAKRPRRLIFEGPKVTQADINYLRTLGLESAVPVVLFEGRVAA